MKKSPRHPSPWIVECSIRVYQWLLWLGPVEFCREYAPAILQVFRECCQEAYTQRGVWGVLRLWLPMFGEVVGGMLEEHLYALQQTPVIDERTLHMLRTQRRSLILIFIAFVFFGFPWLFFQAVVDPTSQWELIIQAHPVVEILYRTGQTAGEIAFLMLLLAGLPIIFVAVKQALASLRRDILALIGLSAFMSLVFVTVTILLLTGHWSKSFDPNGGIYAVVSLLFVGIVTLSLSLAVARSQLSERVLRFALWPATIVTVAMLVSLIAISIESVLLGNYAPQVFGTGLNVGFGNLVMAVAILGSAYALWRGYRANRLTAA